MKQDETPWQIVSSKVVYQNRWMKVVEDKTRMPDGTEGIYGHITGDSGVFIIALTEKEEIYLIESFRHPLQKWQWELPTGGTDAGMTPLEAAKNELSEELGITADKWTHVGSYTPSHNGFMSDTQNVFVAENLHQREKHVGNFESIRAVKTVSHSELMDMIRDSTLNDGQTLAALMQFIVWYRDSRSSPGHR